MKKLFYYGAMSLALIATSCSGSGSSANDGLDSLFSQAQTDSMLTSFSIMAGNQVRANFEQAMRADSSLSKVDFIKGLQYAYASDTATAYGYGMQVGLQLLNTVKNFEQQGLKVDPSLVLNGFKQAFTADSVDAEAVAANDMLYRSLQDEYQNAVKTYKRAQIENSEECRNNVQAGLAYIDSLRKADPEVQVAASGVAYKIENPGEGEKLTKKDRIKMRYQAKTLDGRVFDQMTGDNLRTVMVSTRVPGLQEGLAELGQGGKATIVIPGKEAYGIDNMRRFNLGPNETVIYEVEVVEVIVPETK